MKEMGCAKWNKFALLPRLKAVPSVPRPCGKAISTLSSFYTDRPSIFRRDKRSHHFLRQRIVSVDNQRHKKLINKLSLDYAKPSFPVHVPPRLAMQT